MWPNASQEEMIGEGGTPSLQLEGRACGGWRIKCGCATVASSRFCVQADPMPVGHAHAFYNNPEEHPPAFVDDLDVLECIHLSRQHK